MKKQLGTAIVFLFLLSQGRGQDYKFGKVSKEELMEKTYSQDSSAAAAVLYRNVDVRFEYLESTGFRVITEIHERVKIYKKDGFAYATISERLRKQGRDYEKVFGVKAITYNLEGGKIVESKLKNSGIFSTDVNKYYNEDKFTMPNVVEGSVLEYEYRISSPFYYSLDDVELQYDIPIKRQEVSIKTPEYFVFKPTIKGYLPVRPNYSKTQGKININSKTRSTNGYVQKTSYNNGSIEFMVQIADFTMDNVPALKEEPYVNDMDNYRSAVNYELEYVQFPGSTIESYTTTWEKVVKTIYESDDFGGQLNRSKYFRADLATLLEGKSDDLQKMSAIFSFVQDRMNWNGFLGYFADKGVENAYKERSGNIADINLILTAMLTNAGLKTKPVLISTRDNGVPLFPTINGFNYVVASVNLNGNIVLLDATNKFAEPNILPTRAMNWFGRVIKEDGSTSTVSVFPERPSKELSMLSVNIKDNGTLEGKLRKTYMDHKAYIFRNSYNDVNRDDYLDKVENKFQGMEIANYEVKNDKTIGKPIIEEFEYKWEDQIDVLGDKIYFSPMFQNALVENPFKLEERSYPIDYAFPWNEKYNAIIAIPEGYKVISRPEDVKIVLKDQLGSFSFRMAEVSNTLQVSVEFEMNKAVIPPNYYADIKELYRNVVEKETEKVVLSKITEDGHTESTVGSR